jgi:hypothetical protein
MVFKKETEGDVTSVKDAKIAVYSCPFDGMITETKVCDLKGTFGLLFPLLFILGVGFVLKQTEDYKIICSDHEYLLELLNSKLKTLSGGSIFILFLFFSRRFLCSPGCPGTHSVDQAHLELRNPPASASQVLG